MMETAGGLKAFIGSLDSLLIFVLPNYAKTQLFFVQIYNPRYMFILWVDQIMSLHAYNRSFVSHKIVI